MIRSLQGLRFFFIVTIIVSHLTTPNGFKYYCYSFGETGVSFFFMLSGFMLSYGYWGKIARGEFSYRVFLRRRLIKIYPLYLSVLLLTTFFDWRDGAVYPWWQYVAHTLLLQSWCAEQRIVYSLVNPAWFLSCIVAFYCAFKWLCRFIVGGTAKVVCIVLCLMASLYVALCCILSEDYSGGFVYTFPALRIMDFMLGIALYRICLCSQWGSKVCQRIRRMSKCSLNLLDLAMVGMYPLLCLCERWIEPNLRCVPYQWLPVMIWIVYFFASDGADHSGLITRLLGSKVCRWLGSLSFEMYILHIIVSRFILWNHDVDCTIAVLYCTVLYCCYCHILQKRGCR